MRKAHAHVSRASTSTHGICISSASSVHTAAMDNIQMHTDAWGGHAAFGGDGIEDITHLGSWKGFLDRPKGSLTARHELVE